MPKYRCHKIGPELCASNFKMQPPRKMFLLQSLKSKKKIADCFVMDAKPTHVWSTYVPATKWLAGVATMRPSNFRQCKSRFRNSPTYTFRWTAFVDLSKWHWSWLKRPEKDYMVSLIVSPCPSGAAGILMVRAWKVPNKTAPTRPPARQNGREKTQKIVWFHRPLGVGVWRHPFGNANMKSDVPIPFSLDNKIQLSLIGFTGKKWNAVAAIECIGLIYETKMVPEGKISCPRPKRESKYLTIVKCWGTGLFSSVSRMIWGKTVRNWQIIVWKSLRNSFPPRPWTWRVSMFSGPIR